MAKRAGVGSAIAIMTVMGSVAARADVPPPTPAPARAAPAPATPAAAPTVAPDPPPAIAATRALVTPPPVSRSRRWYGGQLILGEFVGVSVMALGTGISEGTGTAVGAVAWGLGVPAIHAAHGNPGRMLASLALRGTLTLGGAYLGGTLACREPHGEDYRCDLKGAGTGGMLGYLAAAIIDVAFLAYERRPEPVPAVAPTVTVARDRVAVGLGGTF